MHRMKIGLIAAGTLLAFTAGMYFAVTSSLSASATAAVEQKVTRAERLYRQISRVEGIDFANMAAERARKPSVVAVADIPDLTARREAAYQECEVLNAALHKESRKADILAILDSTGKVLARDLNPNAMFGEDLRAKFPAVEEALKGAAVKDVWTLSNRMTQVALAPIPKPDGTIVGALLIGYVLSAKQAQSTRDQMGVELAFFHGGRVHGSSFTGQGAGEEAREDVNRTQILAQILFGSLEKYADVALQKGAPSDVSRVTIEGAQYAVITAPLVGNFADKTSGVAVLVSVADSMETVDAAGCRVLVLGVVAIIIVLASVMATAKRFIAPLDKIELGVGEIINGNIDYTFKPVGPDFEGLSNSLNVMLARLLGREEPSEDAVEEEEGESKKWKSEQMIIEEGDGSAPAGGSAALAQEGEAAYYPRLFNDYVAALRAAGQPAQGVSVPAFMAKLRLTEAGLKEKWTCRMVRFRVATEGGRVIFKAVRI